MKDAVTPALAPAPRFLLGLGLLLLFLLLGDALARAAGWPLPGSIVGMVLLWASLSLGLVRLEWLEGAADGLLGILGLLFVPATVGAVQFAAAGAEWLRWVVILATGLVVGSSVAALLAERLTGPADSPEGEP